MSDFNPNDVAIQFSDAEIPVTDRAPISDAPPDPPPPVPDDQRSTLTRIMGEQTKGRRRTQRGTPKPPKEKRPDPPKDRPGALVKPLTEMYASIGMVVFAVDQECGRAVLENAENCAKALDSAARENATVRRIIHRMVETSVMGAVIAAHAPIAISIARHHAPQFRDAPPMPRPDAMPDGHTTNGSAANVA